jgi:hypothetical protein
MTIKVLVNSIEESDLKKIINYYNLNISPDQPELEILNRYEGGFKIKTVEENKGDENNRIKQLRWKNKCLLPYKNYKGFDKSEEIILFYAMKSVLGNNVILE